MILPIAILIAAAALTTLNFGGALDLTGNLAMAAVLGCMATAQWAAARQALVLSFRNPEGRRRVARWGGTAMLLAFYVLAAAWVTVPLTAAKLDSILGIARDMQQVRFDDEQAAARRRAGELGTAFGDMGARLRRIQAHAEAMRDLEAAKGGSCLTSRGDQPGEIYRWRAQEARLASELVARTAESLDAATRVVSKTGDLKLDAKTPVQELERQLGEAVDDLNALLQAPVLATLREFVRQADEAGRDIAIPRRGLAPEKFACVDAQRASALAGLLQVVEATAKKPALPRPLLLDASNPQALAKAKLIGGWSELVAMLPTVRADRLVDPAMRKRYGLETGGPLLTEQRVSWGVAWVLELLLLSLIALEVNAIAQKGRAQRLREALTDVAIERAAKRDGTLGTAASTWLEVKARADAAERADAAPDHARMPDVPLFDATNAQRWSVLSPYVTVVGDADFLLVPVTDGAALAAARQAVLLGMAQPVVQALTGPDLARHPQLRANPGFAQRYPAVDKIQRWSLFRLTHRPLVQYLLDQWLRPAGDAP